MKRVGRWLLLKLGFGFYVSIRQFFIFRTSSLGTGSRTWCSWWPAATAAKAVPSESLWSPLTTKLKLDSFWPATPGGVSGNVSSLTRHGDKIWCVHWSTICMLQGAGIPAITLSRKFGCECFVRQDPTWHFKPTTSYQSCKQVIIGWLSIRDKTILIEGVNPE